MSVLLQTLRATGNRVELFSPYPAGGVDTPNDAAGTHDGDDATKDSYVVPSTGASDQYTNYLVIYDLDPLALPGGSSVDFIRGFIRARGGSSDGPGNLLNDASILIHQPGGSNFFYIPGDGGIPPDSGSTALDPDESVWTDLMIEDSSSSWNDVLVGVPDTFSQGGIYITIWKDSLSGVVDFTLEASEFRVEIWGTLPSPTHDIVLFCGAGGTIIPPGGDLSEGVTDTVDDGSTPTYTATPDPGWEFFQWVLDALPLETGPEYTFDPVHEDHQLIASFIPIIPPPPPDVTITGATTYDLGFNVGLNREKIGGPHPVSSHPGPRGGFVLPPGFEL